MGPALLAVIGTMIGGAPVGSGPRPGLECRVAVLGEYQAGQPVPVRFTLTNRGRSPVAVLNWNTPLEGLLADVFTIHRSGRRQPWSGPSIKRGEPDAEEYVIVGAGSSVSEDVDLALGYDLKSPGRYKVALRLTLHDVVEPPRAPRPRSEHEPMSLTCRGLEITIR